MTRPATWRICVSKVPQPAPWGNDVAGRSDRPIEPLYWLARGFVVVEDYRGIPPAGEEHIVVGLYERLLREAAELPEDANRARHQRMSDYVGSRRKAVPEGGGYVTSEELQKEQEKYLGEVRTSAVFSSTAPVVWLGDTGLRISRANTRPSTPG